MWISEDIILLLVNCLLVPFAHFWTYPILTRIDILETSADDMYVTNILSQSFHLSFDFAYVQVYFLFFSSQVYQYFPLLHMDFESEKASF